MVEGAGPDGELVDVADESVGECPCAVLSNVDGESRLDGDVGEVVADAVEVSVGMPLIETHHAVRAARRRVERPLPEVGNVRAEILAQTETLSRRTLVERVIDRDGILIVVAKSVSEGLEVVNRFAPEHFEIMTKDALRVMKGVRAAGAVFAGAWTPESAGDFVAGPSHVLPTGGAANMFNGLTPDDFRRRHSFVAFTKEDLAETRRTIEAFAAVEGLDGHGRAASIRFAR